MAGHVPATHDLSGRAKDVDGWAWPSHDGEKISRHHDI